MELEELSAQMMQDPRMAEAVEEIAEELVADGVAPELLDTMIEALQSVLDDPESYPQVREYALMNGVVEEDELPTEFNPQFVVATLLAMVEVRRSMGARQQAIPQMYAKGGLAQAARRVQEAGRDGDTMLAHINPREAEVLRRMGGAGSINPLTGLPEFKKKGGIFKKILRVAVPVAAAFFGGPALASALGGGTLGAMGSGAIIGGLGSAVSGGNILKGALMGGLGGGLGSAFGGESLGSGIGGGSAGSTGLTMPDSFGAWGETAAKGIGQAASSSPSALGSSLSGGMEALGATGGGLAAPGLGIAMEGLGGLGTGISGALPGLEEAGQSFLPSLEQAKDVINTGKNLYSLGKTATNIYNTLNPPEPEQYSQQNTQRQMQQLGGMPGINTNRAFGLGGTQSRGVGQVSRLGMGFRNGGLARCTCKGN